MTSAPKTSSAPEPAQLKAALEGTLLGTAVGDALGLPAEGLSPGRIRRLWKGDWRMRFLFRRGMVSDDTEHTLMVAQALLSHSKDPVAFQRVLAWKFRWWFAGLPGGVGLATARACLKLWLWFPPEKSAVNSAGGGPAMRSAIIGAFFADDPESRRGFVLASSRLTHKSWQAETAALAVAEAAAKAVTHGPRPNVPGLFLAIRNLSSQQEWQLLLSRMETALGQTTSVSEFVRGLGLEGGVSGYALHVVPVALYAWMHHQGEFRSALLAAIECGGDTDTVGAILGALCGAGCGSEGIPQEWVNRVADWPRSIAFIRVVAHRLAEQKQRGEPIGEVRYFWPGLILRNMLFLAVVILHGFRRLLPPY